MALDPNRVTVFYGPNEAGKSTLLAFIRTILFGFPSRNRDAHYPPLAGGRHGGRIHLVTDGLVTDGGEGYTLERHAGAHRGPLTITNTAGATLDANLLLPQIMGQATEDIFRHVFAFSLDELQQLEQLDLLGNTSVSNVIYNAAQGVPALSEFTQKLAGRQDAIFRPGGRSTAQRRVTTLVNDIRTLDAQLQEVAGNAGRYGQLTTLRESITTELETLTLQRTRKNGELAEIGNLLDGWEDWVELSGCHTQLELLPTYENFPDDAIPRLEAIQERLRQADTDVEQAAEQVRVATEAATTPIPNEALMEVADRIEEIRRGRNSFDESVRDLPERQSELREFESRFAQQLEVLGRPWDEADLEAFDASLGVRNRLDSHKAELDRSAQTLNESQRGVEQQKQGLQDRQLETREAREQLPPEPPPLDAPGLAARQDALRAARGCLDEFERQRQNQENLQGQLNALTSAAAVGVAPPPATPVLLLALLCLGAVGMAAAGFLLGGPSLYLGLGGSAVLVVLAAGLWLRGRGGAAPPVAPVASPLERQVADAQAATERARQALLAAAAPLGLDGQPNGASLDSVAVRLDAARSQLTTWETANARVEEAASRETSQEQRLAEAVKGQESAAAAHQQVLEGWQQWLQERQLDDTLTPDGMSQFLNGVATARTGLEQARANAEPGGRH